MTGFSSFINRLHVVKQIPAFSQLGWLDLQKIARRAVISGYRKGEVICREGTPADFFYCLVTGRVQAYSINSFGIKENVEFIHRGMYFGIISILTGENHSLNFEALNDSVILKIFKDDFHAVLKSIPQLGVEFSQSLSKRIRIKVRGVKSIFESTIISVYSPVKGTGSSTYAAHLALSLAKETRKKVIFVNIHSLQNDPGPMEHSEEISFRWKIPPVKLEDIVSDDERIFGSIVKNDLAVDLLNVAFDPGDTILKNEISPFVSTLVGSYHYVVVDLPNEMDDIVLETLTQSDLVHLMTTDDRKDLDMIRHVVDQLEAGLRESFREEKIRVLIRARQDKIYLSFEDIDKAIDYPVYISLPYVPPSALKQEIQSRSLVIHSCEEHGEYTNTVTRIARQIGGVMVGVVLSGGAALGIAHIGVLRVLEQENIPVDILVGSSMGALLGTLWAAGYNADQIEQCAKEFQHKRSLRKLIDLVFPISGIVGGRAIAKWLRKHLGGKTFYSTKIPLKVVAYDIIRREEIVIDSGSLVDAVRKSVSIPGVITPVKNKDQVIIDGGVLNPLPTNVLAGLGIKKIIAVNVLQSPADVSQGFDLVKRDEQEKEQMRFLHSPLKFLGFHLSRQFYRIFSPNISDIIVRTLQATEYVIAEQSARQADVVIHPDLVGVKWFELYRVDDLVRRGEEAARESLEKIKLLVTE